MLRLIRFDDISINCDIEKATEMSQYATMKGYDCMWCVSPLVHDMRYEYGAVGERVFPAILKAYSDQRCFYRVDRLGVPHIPDDVFVASHGLLHLDHRLLSRETQEMSILVSTSLIKCKAFVPPFNKWNADTENICREHCIELIKFEDGWLSMEHNKFNPHHGKYYLHSRAFTLSEFEDWFLVNDNLSNSPA